MTPSPSSLDDYWKQRAQNEVSEDPKTATSHICALRALVQDECGLHSRTDDVFLLAFLRARKHNVEKAFALLKSYYRMKKNYPVQFEDCLPTEKGFVYDIDGMTVLDQRDNDERIVIIIRIEKADLQKVGIEHLFQMLTTTLNLYLEDERVQIAGVAFILDLKGFGFRHFFTMTPSSARLFAKLFQDSFPVRIKAVHVVNEPRIFSLLIPFFDPFLKEKIKKRIHSHGKNLSSLHAHVPYEILPRQLGGMVSDFNFVAFRRKVEENEAIIRGWRKFGYLNK